MVKATEDLLSLILPADGAAASTHTDSLYTAVGAIHQIVADVQSRILTIQAARRAADALEEDPKALAFSERLKQSLDSLQRSTTEGADLLEKMTSASWQFDQYARQMAASLSNQAPPPDVFVSVSRAELEHLKARADAASSAPVAGQ